MAAPGVACGLDVFFGEVAQGHGAVVGAVCIALYDHTVVQQDMKHAE